MLDIRARVSGDPADLDRACRHFNSVARRYDKMTPEAAIGLLVELILNAIATHQRYQAMDLKFVLPRTDETGHRRWSKAQEAERFINSAMFDRLVGGFGIDPSLARARVLRAHL